MKYRVRGDITTRNLELLCKSISTRHEVWWFIADSAIYIEFVDEPQVVDDDYINSEAQKQGVSLIAE